MKIATTKERILQYIEKKEITKSFFFNQTGIKRGFLDADKLNQAVSDDHFAKIIATYPDININWLITGEGEMLKYSTENKTDTGIPVPVYNLDVRGGMHGSTEVTMDDAQYIERYTFFDNARKDDKAFPVTGQSMMPKYPSGSLILVREVLNWQEYFGYGDCYVLMLKDGRRILKQIMKSEENTKEYVLCTSINPAYPSEELPRKLIQRVFKVVGCQTLENF